MDFESLKNSNCFPVLCVVILPVPVILAIANFNKGYCNVSETLFGKIESLESSDYIKKTKDVFETPFFDVLANYLKEHNYGAGIVQAIMDVSLLDSQSIHNELAYNGAIENIN